MKTDTVAAVAAPSWAISIWCDLNRIYIQLPGTHGPCVLDYPRDAHGLSDVLNLMRTRHATEGMGTPYSAPLNTLRGGQVPLSANSREVVRDLLRKKGVLSR
jgi:hypothetical protein